MAAPKWLVSAGIAAFAVTFTCVFFIDLCHLIYQCGCDHLWGALADHCNIHNTHGRRCPWCRLPPAGSGLIVLGITVPQTLLAFQPAAWPWWVRLAASVAAFPLIGVAHGLVIGLSFGYWQ